MTRTALVCSHCEARLRVDDEDMSMDAAGWKVAARAGGGIEMFCASCAAGALALAVVVAATEAGR